MDAVGGSEQHAVDQKLTIASNAHLADGVLSSYHGRRKLRKIGDPVLGGSRTVHDLAIVTSDADKTAVNFWGEGFIDFRRQPIGTLTGKLSEQLAGNSAALRNQRSFEG